MKKIILSAMFIATSLMGFSQNVEYFEVGPYDVAYKGDGEYQYKMRENINLYEYFELKKDTIINVIRPETEPLSHAIQLNAFMGSPLFSKHGASISFGVNGSWKHQLTKSIYLNAGLSVGFSYREYNTSHNSKETILLAKSAEDDSGYDILSTSCTDKHYKENDLILEIGVPLSIEYTRLDKKKASLYASIGVTPMFYQALKASVRTNTAIFKPTSENNTEGKCRSGESAPDTPNADNNPATTSERVDKDKKNGFAIVPRIDFGGYVPVGNNLMRIGIYGEFKLNCFGDEDIFKNRIGRALFGANVGLVF